MRREAWIGIALLLLGGPLALASSLQISPVMVELQSGQQAAGVTLSNPGNQPLFGQVRVFRWNQTLEDDALEATDDVVASPPLIRIDGGAQQLVRLIVRGGDVSVERSYRVLIDEIPGPDSATANGVTIRLRYSVPVFVEPAGPPRLPKLTWHLGRNAQGWLLRVSNTGEHRGQLSNVRIVTADGQVQPVTEGLLGYALAGKTRQWHIALKDDLDVRGALKVRANINAQPAEAELAVDASP